MTNNTLFAASLLSLLLSSGLPAQGGGPTTGEPPTLTIRLFNYAEAPAVLLDAAAEIGGQIFSRAGIDTVWVICAKSPDQPRHPSCDESPGKSVVYVNILNREMSAKLGTDPDAFGLAFTSDIEFGQFATVFYHRVDELERRWARDAVMGHILAHEIGHLLLGFGGHARHGIMSPRWTKAKLMEAEHGSLNFDKSRARRMRQQVLARAEQDRASKAAEQIVSGSNPR
jgi:hypothetical protein